MNQRTISLVLILALCLGLLSGCGKTQEETTQGDSAAGAVIDPAPAFAKHDGSETVMTVNGSTVTWNEFFYQLYNEVYAVRYYSTDGLVKWDAPCTTGSTMTNGEYVWQTAVDTCVRYHVLEQKLADMGITLTAEDEQTLAQRLQSDIEQLCGEDGTEEAFDAVLKDMYMSRETYDFMNEVAALYDKAYDTVFGKNGERMDEEEIRAYVAENEYITAKHILIKTVDDANQALPESEIAEKEALAESILTQLREAEGDRASLLAKFDELMNEYSEDTGLSAYPDGYTFHPGEMVDEFQSGAEALADYEISGLVQSQFGYHIILRLPTTRESVVDYVDGANDYTIGTYAAVEAFGALLSAWTEEAEIVWSKDFEKETPENIFALPEGYVSPSDESETEK